jgi:hypothetical protein
LRYKFTIDLHSRHKVPWGNATLFDLVIDTSKVPLQSAVNWLIESNEYLSDRPEEGLPTTNEIEVRGVLAGVVSETLDCQATH